MAPGESGQGRRASAARARGDISRSRAGILLHSSRGWSACRRCCNAAAGRTRREGRHGGAPLLPAAPAAELCQAAAECGNPHSVELKATACGSTTGATIFKNIDPLLLRLLLLLLPPLVHLGHRHPLEQRVGCADLVFGIDPASISIPTCRRRLYDRRHAQQREPRPNTQTDAVCHGCYAFLKESGLDGSSS
jgi:hypothetical protein